MRPLITSLFGSDDVSYGNRVLTQATAIMWVGWGFAESLIPVLLFAFAHSFAGAGLLRSAFDIAFIIAMPIAGVFADKFRATSLVIFGFILYSFIGVSYFLAGATGIVLYIVLARVINGVSNAFSTVGRESFARRHTPPEKLAINFGYFDTVANFWWIVAALAGIVLVRFFSISQLLLLITPAAIIATIIVVRFRHDAKRNPVLAHTGSGNMTEIVTEVRGWNKAMRLLAFFGFFISFMSAVVTFFIPIEAFVEGASVAFVVLTTVAATIPSLFGIFLGKLYDRQGTKIFFRAMLAFGVLLLTLAFFDSVLWKIALSFFAGLIVELLSLGTHEMASVHSDPDSFGRMDGLWKSISDIGSLLGPIVVGIMLDHFGAHPVFSALGISVIGMGILFKVYFEKKK